MLYDYIIMMTIFLLINSRTVFHTRSGLLHSFIMNEHLVDDYSLGGIAESCRARAFDTHLITNLGIEFSKRISISIHIKI
jgi:hypothetical protein